ncbi:MAG TPA: serine hydrolase domain-containing protein [Acidimicrobiales bacterium]|nr:serine hydrolase domain-containing protein [Acidimicrobiales bacterium]
MHLEEMATGWPAEHVAAAVSDSAGTLARTGDPDRPFALASVTKLLTAWAVLIAVEEGIVDLDVPVTDADATIADLLAHAGGLGPDGGQLAPPRTRRIYSNAGYEVLGELVARAAAMTFAHYVREAVFEPLGMVTSDLGSPAHGAVSNLAELARFAAELLAPQLIATETAQRATRPHLGDLAGVLPGFGRQDPNPWGLGPEIRGAKSPHWTAPSNSPETFGHFGQSGTFVWVDPSIDRACVVVTDEPFGPWAIECWPQFNEQVVAAST